MTNNVMSFLTDLLSQFGENYGKNTAEDYAQKDKDTAMAREQQLASLQQNVAYTNSPVFQEFWGKTDAGKQYKAQQEAELARLTQLQRQGYPTTTGQDIQQAVGNTISDTASGRPFTRLAKTEGQSKNWDAFQNFGGNAVMAGLTAFAPTPKFMGGTLKSLPKPMSVVPEEAGLIAKASGAKPIYGAAQKGVAKAGATASPAQLKSMTDLQASMGGDVGAAMQTERAVPMRGHTLNQAEKQAPKVAPKAQTAPTATATQTPVAQASAAPTESVPKTKWQQVKKGVGSAAKVAGIGGAGFMLGHNWDDNAGLPAQPAPAPAPTQPVFDPNFASLAAPQDPSAAAQVMQQSAQAPAQKEPSFIEKLLQQGPREGSLTEEQLLQRIEGIINQPQQPPPQVPDGKPTSTLGMIMDALGRGLIAGGTGQADPDAAQKLEMERMVTNQNLAQNARKLTPQQEMTIKMLQSLLSNKREQDNTAQQGAQGLRNALIQAIMTSRLASQQTSVDQQFTAGQNELDRESAERIAGTRSAAAAQKAAMIQKFLESLNLGGAQAPSDPRVKFD